MEKKSLQKLGNIEDAEILSGEFEDVSNLEEDIDDTLASITSEFDADKNDVVFLIKVYRVIEKTGKSNWLFNCQPEELPIMERLRDNYGTGQYQIRVYKNRKLYRRFSYSIEAPKNAEIKPTGENVSDILKAMFTMQQQQFNQLKEFLLQSRAPAPATDPVAIMNAILGGLVQMKTFIAPPVQQNNGIELLIKGIEMGRDFGRENGESSFMDLFRDLIKSPLLEKAIDASTQVTQPGNVPCVPNVNVNAKPAIQNSSNLTGNENMNLQQKALQYYVDMLVKKAESNADPVLYADFILDNLPEETIRAYINRDDLIAEMSKINPAVSQYTDWFTALRDNIREMLTGETDDLHTDNDVSRK